MPARNFTRWKIGFAGPLYVVVSRSTDGPGLCVDAELFGSSWITSPIKSNVEYYAVSDTSRSAARIDLAHSADAFFVLGRRRVLSLDSDKSVHALAWNIASYLRSNSTFVRPTDHEQEATFGLMHAIRPSLRTYVEIGELVDRLGIQRVYIPVTKLFNAHCLRGFLESRFEYSPESSSEVQKSIATKPITDWPKPDSLIFADADFSARPFARQAILQLKNKLSLRFKQEEIELPTGRLSETIAKFSLAKMASLYSTLRTSGLHRSAAALIALSATVFDGGKLANLNRIARQFYKLARNNPGAVTVAVNMGRLPVLFALSGAQAGGGRTAVIETMLVTRLKRYPAFEPDDYIVIDKGQASVLSSAGVRSRIHACGSVLIEARAEKIEHTRLTVPKILIASQPSDREMRQIMALACKLPNEVQIQIAPHSEDQIAFQAWLSKMTRPFANRAVSFGDASKEPLEDTSVVITATSNIAILAQALKIPSILITARRHLEDAFYGGPYPGICVDPEDDDAEAQFQKAFSHALSGGLGDYQSMNEIALRPGVVTRISEALIQGS